MSTSYEAVIGLEIHLQLKTHSRMFGSAPNEIWGAEPNSQVSPVDLGLPGALPVPNKVAIAWTQRLGKVLNCELRRTSRFDRKNYFYPDLPKGYQISQYDQPLCESGFLEISTAEPEHGNVSRTIRIRRIHLEEDTGKSMHRDSKTWLDFNKSGVPLVELVTEPDFSSSEECSEFAKMVQEAARTLEISDVDMEKGNMRLEANISVRKVGDKKLPDYRVEVKNINSFKFMRDAIDYEIERQIAALEKGGSSTRHKLKLEQETRGWDERQKMTVVQRTKEEAHDYRYFPEPDIPPLEFDEEYFADVLKDLPKMPWTKEKELIDQGIRANFARTIAYDAGKYVKFTELLGQKLAEPSELAKIIANISALEVKVVDRVKISELLLQKSSSSSARPQLTNADLEKLAEQVIADNPQAVADYQKGKTMAIKFLLGQVMQKTRGPVPALVPDGTGSDGTGRGQADPNKIEEILVKLLK